LFFTEEDMPGDKVVGSMSGEGTQILDDKRTDQEEVIAYYEKIFGCPPVSLGPGLGLGWRDYGLKVKLKKL
jgi:hypothetical protein